MLMTFLFGCDGNDWEEDVEVTEEEYKRLQESHDSGEDFYKDESVRDIYEKVYDIAVESATASLLEFNEDIAEKYANVPDFKATDLYHVSVQYYLD